MWQNDPTELLEVYDVHGQPTGTGLTRGEVHRRGVWHLAFHCWVVRAGAVGPEVVLQRRSAAKDTFPLYWDASAAGHWRMGEQLEDAAREIEEELGLRVPVSALVPLGRERTSRRHPNGLIDRELHAVHLLRWQAPLVSYDPSREEVSALAAFGLEDVERLAGGRLGEVVAREAVEVTPAGLRSVDARMRREEFVPYSAARLRRLARGARALLLLAGE